MKKEKAPKIEKILKHLKKCKRKGITGMEARDLYGSYRLSDAIFKLRERGWSIRTEIEEYNGDRYARYVLNS